MKEHFTNCIAYVLSIKPFVSGSGGSSCTTTTTVGDEDFDEDDEVAPPPPYQEHSHQVHILHLHPRALSLGSLLLSHLWPDWADDWEV